MKKVLLCLLLISSFSFQLHANAENIIQQFSNSKDVYRIHIGRVGMSLIRFFAVDAEYRSAVKEIKSLEVLTLKDNSTKDNYLNKFKTLKDDEKYTTLLTVKNGDDNVRIMIKKEKDVICELIVIVSDTADITMVRLKGKIKESDLETIIAQHNKKR